MIALLAAIPGILKAVVGIGDTVKSISGDIAKAKIAALEAGTEEKKIEAQQEVKVLEARQAVLIEEAKSSPSGSRWNQGFRMFLSAPAAVIIWKIIVWDRVLGLGTTPRLSTEEWTYIWMVCGFYLVYRTVEVIKR